MFCLFSGNVTQRLCDHSEVPPTSQEKLYTFKGLWRKTTEEQREEKGGTDFWQIPVLHQLAVGLFLNLLICKGGNKGSLKCLTALKIYHFNSYLNKIQYIWRK